MELRIDGWKTHLIFSSAHLIAGYGNCGRLHGHTYAIHVHLQGEPDEQGILVDFRKIKDTLRIIIEKLDHRVLIPQVMIHQKDSQQVMITAQKKSYSFPREDCVFLPMESVTAENLAHYILGSLVDLFVFPFNVHNVSVGVDEGVGQGAWVHREL